MNKSITLPQALIPLFTMIVCFIAGSFVMETSTELLIVVMLCSATAAGIVAFRLGHTWDDIQRSTGEKFASVLPAVLILLTIGMLIGTWVFSGTIPLMIYYGIKLVNPQFMIVTAFLATCIMSLCTGTSWGSAGTIGVALMGMAAAMGAPLAATAGAVVSGAYFGDKLSPLSDSTNICAIGANAYLYDHIRNMLYTAIPSFVLALLVYFTAGFMLQDVAQTLPDSAVLLLDEIDLVYELSLWVLVPPIVVLTGSILRYPAVLTMAVSSIFALFIGIGLQGFSLQSGLVSAVSGFNVEMLTATGINPQNLGDNLTTLLNRGGLYSMVDTLLVIISAFLLAGGMEVSGGLNKIIDSMLKKVRTVFSLIAVTMTSGGIMISLTSHGGVTALIVGNLFQKAFKKQGLAPENLSRSMEDSVTIVEPLMPWTVSAIFMATTLNVPTISYLPWATFCFTGPIFSLLLAASFKRTGYGLKRL